MSHYMTALAMKQQGLKPATKIVLYWLADHHNGTTGLCIPSQKRLAELCEMTDRSVRTHLDTLQTLGLIQVIERKRDNGSQTSNEYKLLFDAQNLPTPMENISSPPMQNLPTLNLGINNLGKEPNTSSKDDGDMDLFNRVFWSKYPKKVGKKAAFKSFKAVMKQVDRGDVHYGEFMTAFEKYVDSMKGKDTQFVKHLSTWLNGEHWTDEV